MNNLKRIDQLILKTWLVLMLIIGAVSPFFVPHLYAWLVSVFCIGAALILVFRAFHKK